MTLLDNSNVLNMSHSQSCVAESVQLRRGILQKNTRVSVVLPNWLLLKSISFLIFILNPNPNPILYFIPAI